MGKDNEMNEDDASAQDTPKKSEHTPNLDENSTNSIDELITSQDSVDEISMDQNDANKKSRKEKNFTNSGVENDNTKTTLLEENAGIECKDDKCGKKSGQKLNNQTEDSDKKVDDKKKGEKRKEDVKKEENKKEDRKKENSKKS